MFDVEQARKTGYSDSEILTHLLETRKFDIEGAKKAGYSESEIINHLSSTETKKEKPGWIEPARAGLETVGVLGGGLIGAAGGPVGAVAGAGLGYAGMKGLADIGEEALGYKKPSGLKERSIEAGEDILKGGAMEAGGQVIGKGLELGGKRIAEKASKWYESALKIPPSVPNEIRQKAIETGIEGRYLPTQKGLVKLQKDIEAINQKIATSVDQASQTGTKIDMADVVQRIDQLKGFYNRLPKERARVFTEQLDEIQSQYLSGGQITQKQAQQMKQTIYALHRKHYGELKTLAIEGDKAVARGLKEELVKANPELANLNAKDSALINLEEVIERAVNRTRNYDVVRLGDTIMSTTGAVLGGPPGAGTAFLTKRILESPMVKSRLAFALSKAKSITGGATGRPLSYMGARVTMTEND